MKNKVKLKNIELKKSKDNTLRAPYYLSLEYEIERVDGLYKFELPHVDLPILTDSLDITQECYGTIERNISCWDGTKLRIEYENGIAYKETLIKKKTRKMTLAEIEKELGYKVEVVSEK